ncbi:hypothetical protein ACWGIU_28605 [Streptomyces sp. NPDC054840]
MAIGADPSGGGLGAVTDAGTLRWTERYTGDVVGAAGFHRAAGTTDEAAFGVPVPIRRARVRVMTRC